MHCCEQKNVIIGTQMKLFLEENYLKLFDKLISDYYRREIFILALKSTITHSCQLYGNGAMRKLQIFFERKHLPLSVLFSSVLSEFCTALKSLQFVLFDTTLSLLSAMSL